MTYLSPAQKIAEIAANLRLETIPKPVIARAKLHILDCLGPGLAATQAEFDISALEGVAALAAGTIGPCTVIGSPLRLPPRDAALANGILVHGLDFDDTHLASIIHPTCTALPA